MALTFVHISVWAREFGCVLVCVCVCVWARECVFGCVLVCVCVCVAVYTSHLYDQRKCPVIREVSCLGALPRVDMLQSVGNMEEC